MKMKNILPLMSAAALTAFVSCSKWTESENLEYHKTPAEEHPEEYAAYLSSIRDYKATEHRVMLVTMEGTSTFPSRQNQHLISMPDSADYILMKNAFDLHETLAGEIKEVYDTKMTKSLVYVDFSLANDAWDEYDNAREEAGKPEPAAEEIKKFFADHAQMQLDLCDRYGFFGIVVSFLGNTSTQKMQASLEGFLTPVKSWIEDNSDKLVFLRGSIRNINTFALETEGLKFNFAGESTYHIIAGGENSSVTPVNQHISRTLGTLEGKENVPQDRVILELTVPSEAIPEQKGFTPYEAAAKWLLPTLGLNPDGTPIENFFPKTKFTPCGLCVENAHDDYFDLDMIYKRIRTGITAFAN